MSYRRTWLVVGVMLAVLWLFVRRVRLTPVRIAKELLIGLAIGMPVAYSVRRFYDPRIDVARGVRAFPYFIVYLVLFLKELVRGNIDVAYRVLHPDMAIAPDVVEFPLRVQTDLAIVTIANSITLTPGTLTMDYDSDRNALYVHAIAAEDRESIVAPIRRWEDYALVLFDEPLSPGDTTPVPEQVADGTDRPETGDGPDPGTDGESGRGDGGAGESPDPDGGENDTR